MLGIWSQMLEPLRGAVRVIVRAGCACCQRGSAIIAVHPALRLGGLSSGQVRGKYRLVALTSAHDESLFIGDNWRAWLYGSNTCQHVGADAELDCLLNP